MADFGLPKVLQPSFWGLNSQELKNPRTAIASVGGWAGIGVVSTGAIFLCGKGLCEFSYEANRVLYRIASATGNGLISIFPKLSKAGDLSEKAFIITERVWNTWRPSAHVTRLPTSLQGIAGTVGRLSDAVLFMGAGAGILVFLHVYVRKTPPVIESLVKTLLPVVCKSDIEGCKTAIEGEKTRMNAAAKKAEAAARKNGYEPV